jgi:hypothetical protein
MSNPIKPNLPFYYNLWDKILKARVEGLKREKQEKRREEKKT